MVNFVINFSLLFILTACQVKTSAVPEGGLVSGHKQVENALTLIAPANGVYLSGATLVFHLIHPFDVTVTGSPRISVTIGGTSQFAYYTSGSGTKDLIFIYTIQPGEIDSNGIAVAPTLDLYGGSLIFNSTTSVGTTLKLPMTSGVQVDGSAPIISLLSSLSIGTKVAATYLDFRVTYSQVVNITGIPQLTLDIGGITKYANYLLGSGSAEIVYRYQVESGLSDKNGVAITAHILNSGTIKDISGNPANLSLIPATFITTLVDSRGPIITSITPPNAGVRVTGNALSLTVNFDEAVTVVGIPSVSLDIGGVPVAANLAAGAGTSSLVFTTAALTTDHFDPDGISFNSLNLELNGGSLKDSLAHDGILSFSNVNISNTKVIYAEVSSWLNVGASAAADGAILPGLSDLSPAANHALANSGSVLKILSDAGLGNKSSADFDGFSSLSFNSQTVKTIAIAFKADTTPIIADLLANMTKGLKLTNGTDLNFGDQARYSLSGAAFSGLMNSCTSCYNATTTKVIMVNFVTPQTLTLLMGGNFDGRISEVFLLNGSQNLSNAQLQKIGTYLSSKY